MTVQTVSNWESGRKHLRLDPSQMLLLCKILGCSLEQLAIDSELAAMGGVRESSY
ncbi:MAG: hypothetical protein ACKO86_18660 [Dolichospermum sp.]